MNSYPIKNILKDYKPPSGSKSYVVDYNFIVTSDTSLLPKTKDFDELDEYSSEYEERGVELEYIFDDGAHVNKVIGTLSICGFHSVGDRFKWSLFLPPALRGEMGKRYRVNIYNGKMTIKDYLNYRMINKLKKFLK